MKMYLRGGFVSGIAAAGFVGALILRLGGIVADYAASVSL